MGHLQLSLMGRPTRRYHLSGQYLSPTSAETPSIGDQYNPQAVFSGKKDEFLS